MYPKNHHKLDFICFSILHASYITLCDEDRKSKESSNFPRIELSTMNILPFSISEVRVQPGGSRPATSSSVTWNASGIFSTRSIPRGLQITRYHFYERITKFSNFTNLLSSKVTLILSYYCWTTRYLIGHNFDYEIDDMY